MPVDTAVLKFLSARTLDVIGKLGMAELKSRDDLTAWLHKHGFSKVEDDFECLYVHAVARRRLEGAPQALLALLRKSEISSAFRSYWATGKTEPLDDGARLAARMFREGDELRSLNVDVIDEVRRLVTIFQALVGQVRSPSQQELVRDVRGIDAKLENTERKLVQVEQLLRASDAFAVSLTPAEAFARDLQEWLVACGAKLLSGPRWVENDRTFELDFELSNAVRGRQHAVVRGVEGDARAGDVHELSKASTSAEKVVLVARAGVSSAARKAAEALDKKYDVLSFDELVDATVNFSSYEVFLENEVKQRRADLYYVPLRCRRPEPDSSGVARPEDASRYASLEDYIEQWLASDAREHVSILGEFGMGKTWFSLRFAWQRLRTYRKNSQAGHPRGRYPLFVSLRDYARAVTVEALLSEFFFDRFAARLPSLEAFRVLNRMGKFLLIFDGFDEMAQKVSYQRVVDNFWELSRVVVPGAKAILTCRDEHFRYAREAHLVLGAEIRVPRGGIVLVPPRFDVIHIEPLQDDEVREAIRLRVGDARAKETADLVLNSSALRELTHRPAMIEMVLAELEQLAGRSSLSVAELYLIATDSQMRRNITEQRTFTSMADKVRFLCELAWEMQASGELKLNYKVFPERIRAIFGARVADKDLDHWQFDLQAQTLLVHDPDGNYFFAHGGFGEYFCAYRLLAETGALRQVFVDRYRPEPEAVAPAESFRRESPTELAVSWGSAPFQPNLVRLMAEMAEASVLRELVQAACREGEAAGFLGSNAASVLVALDSKGLDDLDLSGAPLRAAQLHAANLRGAKLQKADLRGAELSGVVLDGADLRNAMLEDVNIASFSGGQTLAADATGTLLFGGNDQGGWIFDLGARRLLGTYGRDARAWTCDRAVSPDGRYVFQAGADRFQLGVVDRSTHRVSWHEFEAPDDGHGCGVSWHSGGWFAIAGKSAFWRCVLDRDRPRLEKVEEPRGRERVSQDRWGSRSLFIRPPLWVVGGMMVEIWHENDQRILGQLPERASSGENAQISPDGRWVSVSNGSGLSLYRKSDFQLVERIEGNATYSSHAWAPDSSHCVVTAEGRLIGASVDASGDFSAIDPIGVGPAYGAVFSGPRRVILAGNTGIVILDLARAAEIEFVPHLPSCAGADLRGATGLSAEILAAMKEAGAVT